MTECWGCISPPGGPWEQGRRATEPPASRGQAQAGMGPQERDKAASGEGSSPCWFLLHLRGVAASQTRGSETARHKVMLGTKATSARETSGTATELRPLHPKAPGALGASRDQAFLNRAQSTLHAQYWLKGDPGSQAGRPTIGSGRDPSWP